VCVCVCVCVDYLRMHALKLCSVHLFVINHVSMHAFMRGMNAWSLSTQSLYHMLYQLTKFHIREINLNLSLAQESEYFCGRIAASSPSSLRERQRR
jgi:hypothetical protein